MKPRLWNVRIGLVDETKEAVDLVILSRLPSEALSVALDDANLEFDEIDVMTVQENSTSIDVIAWEPSK